MNIAGIAEGFGLASGRVDTAAGFDAALDKTPAEAEGPTLIEVRVKKG
jgi:thiamine pyrophosphate-dependent acetolactate synthase large subunit-like protein